MAKRRVTKRRRATGDAEQSAPAAPAVETGNDEPEQVTGCGYAVFEWPGPGQYQGNVTGCKALARHASVSLPPCDHKQAVADGMLFMRWAKGGSE